MDRLQRIDALLEVDVVGRELGLLFSEALATNHPVSESGTPPGVANLVLGLTQLLLGVLKGARRKGGNLPTQRAAVSVLAVVFE